MGKRAAFYDPDQITIHFGGVLIQGYADGEFISVENMSDGFTSVKGTDGETARSKTNDDRIKVTIKLLQTSVSNLVLSSMHKKDLKSPNGAGVAPFEMADLQGGSIAEGDQAWIVKYPDASRDRSAKSLEWVIEIASGERLEAGN